VPAFRLSCLALTAATAALAADRPPAETLARLEKAATTLDAWQGTYLVTARGVISKVDGDDREEFATVRRMAGGPNGPEVREIVSATRGSKDATAEARANLAKRQKHSARQKTGREKEEGDRDDMDLTLPTGTEAGKFAFTALPADGRACGAAFMPLPVHAKDDALTAGELRWDCATLDPLSVVARPVKKPTGIKEMSLRMEIARAGETMYIARTVTDGVGGVLFIKRKFHIETEIAELAPAGPAGSTP
jgi:hypothetical protein